MNNIPRERIERVLADSNEVAFAYIFGSSAGEMMLGQGSDLDMAVYFFEKPDFDRIYLLITKLESIVGEDTVDLLVLNGCEDFILKNEVVQKLHLLQVL